MRAAEERQRQLRAAEGPNPAQAVAECLSALSALDAMGMWPGELDPISERQVDDVRRRWARIEHRARAEAVQVQTTQSAALSAAIRRAVVRFRSMFGGWRARCFVPLSRCVEGQRPDAMPGSQGAAEPVRRRASERRRSVV